MALIARLILMFSLSAILTTHPANAQNTECNGLDDLACLGSAECMLSQNEVGQGYSCLAAWDRCQIGFRQSILVDSSSAIDNSRVQETVDQCNAQRGCGYVPAGSCFCPADVVCVCGGGTPPNCLPIDTAHLTPPVGVFTVVEIRKASGVAGTSDLSQFQDGIGQRVEFGPTFLRIEGISCDAWEIRAEDPAVDPLDPLLSDVMIGPLESGISDGDKRVMEGWGYGCEGEAFLNVLQVDNRVLVIPHANSAVNLILERPLSNTEIERIQTALMDTKFFDGEVTGELDEPTLSAISRWAEYRNEQPDAYRFARTAITENLFDGMDVFRDD